MSFSFRLLHTQKPDFNVDNDLKFVNSRLKVEPESFGKIQDMARGEMVIGGIRGGDPLLMDFDGVPTNFFRSVVDDHLMQITHVFSGAEHLPDTPLDLALYE